MVTEPDSERRDDVAEHGGRVRSFRHERGNWASYVYVAFHPREEFWEMLDELKAVARRHGVTLSTMEELHVSLSHTVVLRHHWIQPLVQTLRDKLCSTRRFLCVADTLKVYVNKEKSRTFLGLEVARGHQQLLEAVSEVDKSLQEFHLETFYQNPSFHVSLAWSVGDVAKALQGACLLDLQRVVDDFEDSDVLTRFYADTIYCKCGNKVTSIPLC
ncbi:U6 snRNA phosphodiesterase 1 isoform X1 [Phyllobates terribilis]|uniref:U6 snRNA phosphodiesterase 1 isoform X1 n=1 Tax=Phyllobates terribilis TaxID=111132 RepID=UPI003CCB09BF